MRGIGFPKAIFYVVNLSPRLPHMRRHVIHRINLFGFAASRNFAHIRARELACFDSRIPFSFSDPGKRNLVKSDKGRSILSKEVAMEHTETEDSRPWRLYITDAVIFFSALF
jgi:hypothetical protein